MNRSWTVIKREFMEGVRTKTFILGTVFGPVLMILLMIGPILLAESSGGGRATIAIVDGTGEEIGDEVAAVLASYSARAEEDRTQTVFETEVHEVPAGMTDTRVREIRDRVEAEGLDGYLVLPEGLLDGGVTATYTGTNASAQRITRDIDQAVTSAVRGRRMRDAGIPGEQLAHVMAPVPVEKRMFGDEEEEAGAAEFLLILGYIMGFAIYMAVILYGVAVARGVLEEKRDRIVEVILSSIRAQSFMTGKVIGIGATGLLQMAIWALFAVLLLTQADAIGSMLDTTIPTLPPVPGVVAFNFLFFFVAGFFLYGAMFAAAGAIATNDQEMQQLQFPVIAPLILGILFMMPVIENPHAGIVVASTLIPFTAPVVVPMRSAVVDIPTAQWLGSIVLMLASVIFFIWVAAKIYRVGVLSTGKRPKLKELVRWLRTA